MKYTDFITPPKGYGNVPFYWWNGEKLDKDRIAWQLEKLSENNVSGVQINFMHHCPMQNPAKRGGGHGMTVECDPLAFSDEWWDIVNATFRKAKSLGMGVGISDYTIGWIGNGYFIDKVVLDAKLCAEELSCEKTEIKAGEKFDLNAPEGFLSAAIVYSDGTWDPVTESFTAKEDGTVCVVTKKLNPRSVNVLDPEAGKLLAKVFFEYFEEHLDEDVRDALNYCFQDEFIPGCNTSRVWSDSLCEKIKEEKGYDITPLLFEIFVQTPECVKTRLDYADVRTAMIEEGYFKPIYDFHASRGLIYGCDQCSRGLAPGEYGDYFRTVRWFTAPGNDTPFRAANLIKDKVSSSIAHLYDRERTWLEGYHSSGWGTSLASLKNPTSDNFIYGMNLLCMHGLYYSTYGGFWEWAPPDFHFRMPYWDHAKSFYGYYERLSYLLTRGKHVCDVALFYPVSSCDVEIDADKSVKATFSAAKDIFENGIDFDFIDFQSILASDIIDGKLCVAGEKYKTVVVVETNSMRHATLEKLKKFTDLGGNLIILGDVPQYTDVIGDTLPDEVNATLVNSNVELIVAVNRLTNRDFMPIDGSRANVLHRNDGDIDVYFVRNAAKGTVCAFDCDGTAEIWFADGSKRLLLDSCKKNGKTHIAIPFDGDNLIVFNRTDDLATEKYVELGSVDSEIALDGNWDFSLTPTLFNRWGDFRFPVTDDYIGAEVRFPSIDGKKQTVAEYAMWKKILPDGTEQLFNINDRYGIITGSWEEQGYHGLKTYVYDWNVLLKSEEKAVFASGFYLEDDAEIEILTGGILPSVTMIDADIIRDFASVKVAKGAHRLSVEYVNEENKERRGYIVLKNKAKQSNAVSHPLTNKWYADQSVVRLSADGFKPEITVEANIAPATEKLEIIVFGELSFASVNGGGAVVEKIGERDNANVYTVTVGNVLTSVGFMALTVKPFVGYTGGAIFPEPIKEICGKGVIALGDTSVLGGLESYSGKFNYEKLVDIKKENGKRYILDLGTVNCSCKVTVNGDCVAMSCVPPFKFDITEFLFDGANNRITVEVANTLCNHYSTNPSPFSNYPKDAASGLVGPVKIGVYN